MLILIAAAVCHEENVTLVTLDRRSLKGVKPHGETFHSSAARHSVALRPGPWSGSGNCVSFFSEAFHELCRNLLSADAQRDWEWGQR